MDDIFRKSGIFALVLLTACSSKNLRKFDEGDISKEVSADAAKKFEVSEVGTKAVPKATSQVATAWVGPPPAPKKVKGEKVKKKKEETVVVAATPTPTPTPAIPPVRRVDPMPFEVGEKLSYDIRYVGVTAGYFDLEVRPVKQMSERKIYQLHAHARTVKIFELVYRVNDQVDSYWDYEGLFSHRFTMDLDESKQTRKLIELYDYDKNKSYYWNRVDHVEKGFKEDKQEYDITPWSQDLVSSLYYLRAVKLPSDTATEFRYPVILDGKPWEASLHFKKKDKIYAGGKDRTADVYQLDTYQNGESKNKNNTLWISDDEHRYILRVEAKVKVGTFAVALDKIL